MNANRAGRLSAELIKADGPLAFRATQGLCYYELNDMHCIEASGGDGKAFFLYLPIGVQTGTFSLGLSERSPMIIHVTGRCEAELYRGRLELTVGGPAQFSGTFSGLDAEGVEVESGSFRLEYEVPV
jgi:hypothetical protein